MTDDYAKVINADDYTQGLAEHPDIPQADAGILRAIREKLHTCKGGEFRILDLGCGPGRITKIIADELLPIAHINNIRLSVVGLDISEGFLSFAKTNKSGESISYIHADFLKYDFHERYDVVLMQGLFHHVPLSDRKSWIEKCHNILNDDGVVIVGDEFVPEYSSNEERVLKVASLYAYVIAYALQNGHKSLAEIESMNMVDDVCSGLLGAGHSDLKLITFIQDASRHLYAYAYEKGIVNEGFQSLLKDLVEYIQQAAANVAVSDVYNHNRGDYKISIKKQEEEFKELALRLDRQQIYGPVNWLGGMAVLIFKKYS